MNNLKIELEIKKLEKEYQKGVALIQGTKEKMLRIEGAIIKLQELLGEMENNQPIIAPIEEKFQPALK